MSCKQTTELVMGNIFARPVFLEKTGDKIQGHTHNFDHVTAVFKGAIHIDRSDGVSQDLYAGDYCVIYKHIKHEITALEDKTEFTCFYSHRTPQGEVVEDFTGWLDAYV